MLTGSQLRLPKQAAPVDRPLAFAALNDSGIEASFLLVFPSLPPLPPVIISS